MKDIVDFLFERYKGLIDEGKETFFLNWLEESRTGNVDSKRLLYCLAIETKNEIVEKSKYAKIFNSIDYESDFSPQMKFEKAILENEDELHFFSTENITANKFEYCGLIKLPIFGQYYLDGHYLDDELAYVREKLEKGELTDFEITPNTGAPPREISWVSSFEAICKLEKKAKKLDLNPTNLICEKLGLYWDHMGTIFDPRHEWVKLVYPLEMEVKFYQPIAANENWNTANGQFVSYKMYDKMGRARATNKSKTYMGAKEAIHPRIDTAYHYDAFYLGKSVGMSRDTSTILKSARYRYNEK